MTTQAISVSDVLQRLDVLIEAPAATRVVLSLDQALGKRLANPILASEDIPPFSHSAMDGFAFSSRLLESTDVLDLPILGTVYAGHPLSSLVSTDGALRIMTGAPVPDGFDTVIPFECVIEADEGRVRFAADAVKPLANVRLRGEEIRKGALLLDAGALIGPEIVGLAASLGLAELPCRLVRVAVFATGDELQEPGSILKPGHIYNANAHLLLASARCAGAEANYLGILPDDPDRQEAALRKAAETADLILTSGGVGEGDKDHAGAVLSRLGALEHLHVRQRPGKPLSFGRLTSDHPVYVLALPGNPGAAALTASLYARRLIDRLAGEAPKDLAPLEIELAAPVKGREGRTDFVRGTLAREGDRTLFVPSPHQGSGNLVGAARSRSVAILDETRGRCAAGDRVPVLANLP